VLFTVHELRNYLLTYLCNPVGGRSAVASPGYMRINKGMLRAGKSSSSSHWSVVVAASWLAADGSLVLIMLIKQRKRTKT